MNNDNKTQSDKFKTFAREVETDEDEKKFDRSLGRIAKARPSDEAPPSSSSGKKRD